ncbi:MAG: Hsp20 family protein [Spirochaetes bacterium]|jgi:HSP20 family protein|nr:Hsp20 family protein [Spirochaetota bacterium]
MNLTSWRRGIDPVGELDRLQNEINRLFDYDYGANGGLLDRAVSPAFDVVEDDDTFTVYMDLPGVEEKNVDVSIASNVLTIKGTKELPALGEDVKVYRQEEWEGSFQRTLSLPHGVDTQRVQAQMKNGVLTVTLPKREETKPKQIKIDVSK